MGNTLVRCPTCGERVAKKASKCVHCGAFRPILARNPILGGISLALLIVLAVSVAHLFIGADSNPPVGATTVAAHDLWSAYRDNAVNAANTYNGKLLSTSGEISSISVFMDRPCITLYIEGERDYLVCLFKKGESSADLASLRVGDSVTLQGNCSGTRMGGTITLAQTPGHDSPYVYLNDCVITPEN